MLSYFCELNMCNCVIAHVADASVATVISLHGHILSFLQTKACNCIVALVEC